MRRKTFFTVVIALWLWGILGVFAQDSYQPVSVTGDYDNPGGGVSEREIAWNRFENFFENEHCYLIARLEQGYWFFLTIFTFKYGPQQRWGIYGLVVSDSGKRWFAKREVRVEEAKVSHEDLSWESKGTTISGQFPRYIYTLNETDIKARLVVETRFKGWKIGRWYLTPDKKNFGEVFIHVPWGRVSGNLILDGKEIPVTGNGYSDRFHGSSRFDRSDPLFYSVRALTPLPGSSEISIQTSYNHFNPAYGKLCGPSLFIMDEKGFIKASQKVVIRGENFYKHPELGYSFPKRLTVTAQEGDFRFSGIFRADRNLEVLDILKNLPPYIQKIASTFFKTPVFSKWDGIFEGKYILNGRETPFKIRSAAEINLIGGPQAQETY